MKINELQKKWIASLTPIYGMGESRAIAREGFEHYLGLSAVDVALKGDEDVLPTTCEMMDKALSRLSEGYPIQYLTGYAWFNGLKIGVDKSVLIPRKETSMLVDIIVDRFKNGKDLDVVDFGCGSGAIAIALERTLMCSRVVAVDNSGDALKIAQNNARRLNCRIDFVQVDIIGKEITIEGDFDIIVSNPPYIPLGEKNEVDKNVLDNEPHSALFVPDDDPLVFYRAIMKWASHHLAEGGSIFFEINPHYVKGLTGLAQSLGYGAVEAIKDFNGFERFVVIGR